MMCLPVAKVGQKIDLRLVVDLPHPQVLGLAPNLQIVLDLPALPACTHVSLFGFAPVLVAKQEEMDIARCCVFVLSHPHVCLLHCVCQIHTALVPQRSKTPTGNRRPTSSSGDRLGSSSSQFDRPRSRSTSRLGSSADRPMTVCSLSLCVCVRERVCVFVCVSVCMCVYIYIYIYIYVCVCVCVISTNTVLYYTQMIFCVCSAVEAVLMEKIMSLSFPLTARRSVFTSRDCGIRTKDIHCRRQNTENFRNNVCTSSLVHVCVFSPSFCM